MAAPTHVQSPSSSSSSCSLRTFVSRRCHEEQGLLAGITGEPGDVERSPEAYGQSTLTFRDVSCSVRPKGSSEEKLILAPVSGHFEAGTLVALMGPSGCGKTTLLDILAGKKTLPHGGEVFLNGRLRDRLFPRLAAYVPQEDVMFPCATVKEVVLFTERLKQERPSKVTRQVAERAAEGLLRILGLLEVKDGWIGNGHVRGISGGQRKRVSLARGLASGAQVLFCDEPTSGLSSTDAELCVKYMRLVAHRLGVILVVVIHQPRREVARLFDHLLLMTAQPGRAVYNGPMQGAAQHFERLGHPVKQLANPTDHYLDLVTPDVPGSCGEACARYYEERCRPLVAAQVEAALHGKCLTSLELLERKRESLLQFGSLPPVRDSTFAVGFLRQFKVVFARKLRLGLREKQGAATALAAAVVKALVVGMSYLNIGSKNAFSQLGFIFMVLMSSSMDGMVTMPQLIQERNIVKVESSEALYSEWVHILAFSLLNVLLGMLTNSIFVNILFAMSGLDWELFGDVFFWTTALYFTMDGLYGMIAAIAKDSASAVVLSLPFLMFFLLYNGFTVTKKTAPSFLWWAIDVSPVACSIESISMSAQRLAAGAQQWDQAVEHFGYEERAERNAATILVICILFRIVQLVCFKALNNIQR